MEKKDARQSCKFTAGPKIIELIPCSNEENHPLTYQHIKYNLIKTHKI